MSTLVNVAFRGMLFVISGSVLAQNHSEAWFAEKAIMSPSGPAWVDIDDSQAAELAANTAGSQQGAKVALTGSVTVPTAERALFITLGADVRPPIGWALFCIEHPVECEVEQLEARDVVLTTKAWTALNRVNSLVNQFIKPLSDLDHWGVFDRWSYPDDGYGDCEDYVLLKRKMLMRAGFPRQALLITVVLDEERTVHAVLTVKTDKGEFILDNDGDPIVLWSETRYRYVKRQSQSNPNLWIALDDTAQSSPLSPLAKR
jgi:predicted transglutaminase-like cysteine proteinase